MRSSDLGDIGLDGRGLLVQQYRYPQMCLLGRRRCANLTTKIRDLLQLCNHARHFSEQRALLVGVMRCATISGCGQLIPHHPIRDQKPRSHELYLCNTPTDMLSAILCAPVTSRRLDKFSSPNTHLERVAGHK